MIEYVDKLVEIFKKKNSLLFFNEHSLFGVKKFLINFQGGTGGDESVLFAEELMEMIVGVLNLLKISFKIDKKQIIVSNSQYGFFDVMFAFMGIHRVQRVPKTEKKGRIHTSTSSLLVVPYSYFDIDSTYHLSESDVKSIPTTASVKAGGQRLNHINTALRMIHIPTGITIVSQDQRDQSTNYKMGLQLLQTKLITLSRMNNAEKLNQLVEEFTSDKSRNEKDFTYNYKNNSIKCHRSNLSINLQTAMCNPKYFYDFLLEISLFFHNQRIANNNLDAPVAQ